MSPNKYLDGTASGQTVGTGQFHTVQQYQTGSGLYDSYIPKLDSVESIADYPDYLYSNGRMGEFKHIMTLVEKAGFSSWNEALAGMTMDDRKSERSWEQYLADRAADPRIQQFLAETGRGGGGGGGVSNSVNTSISESSRSQAGAILDQNFQSELGRTASKQEIIDFQDALNEQQRNNPTVTTSRSVSGGGSSTSTTQSKGGFDYTRFARQYAQRQPEFKDRYAAVTFMSLLDSAISNPNALDELVAGQ